MHNLSHLIARILTVLVLFDFGQLSTVHIFFRTFFKINNSYLFIFFIELHLKLYFFASIYYHFQTVKTLLTS